MDSVLNWLPSVASCMAIQAFCLGVLHVLDPAHPRSDLQNLHRMSGKTAPTVIKSGLKPRV
jgi:hypothetical protein